MIEIPSVLDAIEVALRQRGDTWDDTLIHVSDLGYTIPVDEGGKCPLQFWLRLRAAEKRPLHRGELWMFNNASEMHIDASAMLGDGLPKVAAGWRVVRIEHGLYNDPAADLGISPDSTDVEKGQLDVELEGPNGEVVIVDWKTRRGDAFRYLDIEGVSARDRLQVQTYVRKRDGHGALICYLDREGQNFGREFPVERNDAAVEAAAVRIHEIADNPVAPLKLEAFLKRVENKGPDSLYLKEPWPCSRCQYLGVSCDGALPQASREAQDRVAANITDGGELKWKDTTPVESMPIIERLLWR